MKLKAAAAVALANRMARIVWALLVRGDHEIRWHWIKGHAGHPENERADELARMAIRELREG